VARATADVRRHPLVRAAGLASEVADQPPLIGATALLFAAGVLRRDARLADLGGAMLASELVATMLKSAIKRRIDRTRPHVVADGGRHRMEPGRSRQSALSSFPSGHTAGAVAVARAAARKQPALAPAAYLAAAAVAAIQVPRAKHYPTDLIAGLAVGLVADALVAGAERGIAALARRTEAVDQA